MFFIIVCEVLCVCVFFFFESFFVLNKLFCKVSVSIVVRIWSIEFVFVFWSNLCSLFLCCFMKVVICFFNEVMWFFVVEGVDFEGSLRGECFVVWIDLRLLWWYCFWFVWRWFRVVELEIEDLRVYGSVVKRFVFLFFWYVSEVELFLD